MTSKGHHQSQNTISDSKMMSTHTAMGNSSLSKLNANKAQGNFGVNSFAKNQKEFAQTTVGLNKLSQNLARNEVNEMHVQPQSKTKVFEMPMQTQALSTKN